MGAGSCLGGGQGCRRAPYNVQDSPHDKELSSPNANSTCRGREILGSPDGTLFRVGAAWKIILTCRGFGFATLHCLVVDSSASASA